MKILLGDFYAKIGRQDIFKPTIGNERLHKISNDNGIRVVNFVMSKNLIVRNTMVTHRKIPKFTWSSPDGKTHSQIDYILIDRRGIQVYLISDCSEQQIVTLTTIWWWQNKGETGSE
jgi:hypothetical protein